MRRSAIPVVLGGLLAGPAWPAWPAWAEPVTVTILQVNDWGRIEEAEGRGGYARFMAVMRAEGAGADDVLVVHAGDSFSPSLLSGFDHGAGMVDLLNQSPLDFFVMGNHEFDFGPENAAARIAQARFPVLNANVFDPEGNLFPGTVESRIVEVKGYRLGFFGLTTPDTLAVSSPGRTEFRPVLATAAAEAAKLRAAGADLVAALVHTGFADDFALLHQGAVDLVLTGHDHDLRMVYDGKAAMMESGSQADYVTAMTLTLDRVKEGEREKVTWRPSFRAIDTAKVTPDAHAAGLVAAYKAKLDKDLDQAVGSTSTELDSRRPSVRGQETAMGNLIADAMRAAVGADLGLTNGGGIRGNRLYPAGSTLKRRDVLTELPFGNKTVKLEVTGAGLLAALENGFSQVEAGAGRFPQVSGMTVEVDLGRPAGSRVSGVRVGDRALDPAASYTLATNDFMARGGDGYDVFRSAKVLIDPNAAGLMASQVIDYVATRGSIAPKVEGRIVTRG